MIMNKPTFPSLLQYYFLNRMMQQRKVSSKTIESYRDTFRIYIDFLKNVYHIPVQAITMEHFEREYIIKFCRYLEDVRGNKATTINNRLAAIHSFLKFVMEQNPEFCGDLKPSLLIPFQKTEHIAMDFITKEEFNAMIALCDTHTFLGCRDKLMLMLLYNTGARVSELLNMKLKDFQYLETPSNASVSIYGKGRKERIVPIWKDTAKYLVKYVETNSIEDDDHIFKNKNGCELTRSGVRSRIDRIVSLAEPKVQTLAEKNISAHTFRHSVAMNLLHAGVDISTIAIWLGHSGLNTTHKYMVADIEYKRKAMERAGTSGNDSYSYKPSKGILDFLNSL